MPNFHLTPWDTKAFGFKTAEITGVEDIALEDLVFQDAEFLKNLDAQLKSAAVTFVYTRIAANNFELKNILQQHDYYYAESSYLLEKKKLKKFEKKKLPSLKLIKATPGDTPAIQELARDSFDYSRFHEDPNISQSAARERYFNWIPDLVKSGADIYICKAGDNLIGINIQKVNTETGEANLVLAGCAKGYEIYAPSLWNEILALNQEFGAKKVTATISGANLGVFNIYSSFDFKIAKALNGFHKFL